MALLAGALNALAYEGVVASEAFMGDWGGGEVPAEQTALFVVIAGASGLLAAEVLIRKFRPALRRDLWSRALVIVFGFVLGGTLTGAAASVPILIFVVEPTIENVLRQLPFTMLGAAAGGYLGAAEGFLLAAPLSALLGLSRGESIDRRRRA